MGSWISKIFAQQGAKVIVADTGADVEGRMGVDPTRVNAEVDDIKSAGGEAISVIGDVADMGVGENIIKTAIDRLGAADILQPDLAICGGISEAMKIAAIASTHNLRLAPHLWTGAIAFAAGMHVSAATSCGFVLEYSFGANPLLQELPVEGFPLIDGMIEIPERPGLGVTVNPEFVKRFAVAV